MNLHWRQNKNKKNLYIFSTIFSNNLIIWSFCASRRVYLASSRSLSSSTACRTGSIRPRFAGGLDVSLAGSSLGPSLLPGWGCGGGVRLGGSGGDVIPPSHRTSGGSGRQLAVLVSSCPVHEAISTGGLIDGLEPIASCIRANHCQLPAVASPWSVPVPVGGVFRSCRDKGGQT